MTSPLPGPWVDPEHEEAEPWLTSDGIVKFFEFPVRIDAMSRRAFHLYWQRHHSPHAMNVTGFAQFMRKYNSGHVYPEPMASLPARYNQDTPFEGAAEVWINSCNEVGDWLGHPLYPELVQPDEPRFIAQDGRNAIFVTKEERLYVPDPDMIENELVKLYLLTSRKDGVTRDAFHRSISDHGKAIVADPGLQARLRKFTISHRLPEPNPIEGMPDCDVDAVIEMWFGDRDKLAAFVADPSYQSLAEPWEAETCDLGRLRAVVAKMRVVHDEFSFQPSTTQPLSFRWEK